MSAGLEYFRGWTRPTQAPPRPPKRPDLCPTIDHPGVTYNPWLDKTWCLCGEVIRPGNQVTDPHVACCGGPLSGEAS